MLFSTTTNNPHIIVDNNLSSRTYRLHNRPGLGLPRFLSLSGRVFPAIGAYSAFSGSQILPVYASFRTPSLATSEDARSSVMTLVTTWATTTQRRKKSHSRVQVVNVAAVGAMKSSPKNHTTGWTEETRRERPQMMEGKALQMAWSLCSIHRPHIISES